MCSEGPKSKNWRDDWHSRSAGRVALDQRRVPDPSCSESVNLDVDPQTVLKRTGKSRTGNGQGWLLSQPQNQAEHAGAAAPGVATEPLGATRGEPA